jgi:acylphosphatase
VIARITGEVQGVNYRVTAAREARRLGLAGWVRNEPDGCVLVDVEGEPEAIEQFLAWCAQGPPHARVASIATAPAAPAGYTDFTIQRTL